MAKMIVPAVAAVTPMINSLPLLLLACSCALPTEV